MNNLWAVPILTLVMVVGLFFGGQALLPEEVHANDDNGLSYENVGYSQGSSGDINFFNVIFYFQFIGISNNVLIAEYNDYLIDCSDEMNIFIPMEENYYDNSDDFIDDNFSSVESVESQDNSNNNISESDAREIAENELIGEDNLQVGSISLNGDVWVVDVLDENSTSVGTIKIDYKTGNVLSKDINIVNNDNEDMYSDFDY